MKEFNLASGAVLKISTIPFAEAKALYQAMLKELRGVQFGANVNLTSVMKDLFCSGFSSQEVENALKKCLSRCLYNGVKIDDSTFEPEAARVDYTVVCLRVIEDVSAPFVNGLSVELNRALAMIPGVQI